MIKNEDGFTLIEIILSIVAFAFICGFVLQMFALAETTNLNAIIKQKAVIEIASTIDVIKTLDSVDELYNDEFFSKSIIDKTDNGYKITKELDEYYVIVRLLEENDNYRIISRALKDDASILERDITAYVEFN